MQTETDRHDWTRYDLARLRAEDAEADAHAREVALRYEAGDEDAFDAPAPGTVQP